MILFGSDGVLVSNSPVAWVEFALAIVLVGFFAFIYCSLYKRKSSTITISIISGLLVLGWLFGLSKLAIIAVIAMTAVVTVTLIQQTKEFTELVSKIFHKKKQIAERVFDRHEAYQKVAIAIESLSKTKTGALITFEKGVKFNEVIKTGTILNAPITPELLTTIFYPGTRLHDGAVVIRRNEILAASVYYTPTTKPLTGKFGSRHRAAIGISELTDSVTIVVSEETGRISIAYKGELIPVQPDQFLRTLEEYMLTESKQEENE